jgi:hypothetical protein
VRSRENSQTRRLEGEGSSGVWQPGSSSRYYFSSIKALSKASGHRIAMGLSSFDLQGRRGQGEDDKATFV